MSEEIGRVFLYQEIRFKCPWCETDFKTKMIGRELIEDEHFESMLISLKQPEMQFEVDLTPEIMEHLHTCFVMKDEDEDWIYT